MSKIAMRFVHIGWLMMMCIGVVAEAASAAAEQSVPVVLEAPVAPGHWLEPYVTAEGHIDVAKAMHATWDIPHPDQDNVAVNLALAIGPEIFPRPETETAKVFKAMGLSDLSKRGPFLSKPDIYQQKDLNDARKTPGDPRLKLTAAREWLAANAIPIDRYLATTADRYRVPYVHSVGMGMAIPSFQMVQLLGEGIALRARFLLMEQHDVIGAVRLAARLRKDGCLMTQGTWSADNWIGMGWVRQANAIMSDIVKRSELPADVERQWNESAWWPAGIEKAYSKSERMLLQINKEQWVREQCHPGIFDHRAFLRRVNDVWDEWDTINREEDLQKRERMHEALVTRVVGNSGGTNLVTQVAQGVMSLTSPRDYAIYLANVMLRFVFPSISYMQRSTREEITRIRLIDFALALHRYRRERGSWPADTAAMPPADVPTDPFSGKPLSYRLAGSDWEIWSVGRDGRNTEGDKDKNLKIEWEAPEKPDAAINF